MIFAAGTYVKAAVTPLESLVFGASPNLIIKENRKDAVDSYAEGEFIYG